MLALVPFDDAVPETRLPHDCLPYSIRAPVDSRAEPVHGRVMRVLKRHIAHSGSGSDPPGVAAPSGALRAMLDARFALVAAGAHWLFEQRQLTGSQRLPAERGMGRAKRADEVGSTPRC